MKYFDKILLHISFGFRNVKNNNRICTVRFRQIVPLSRLSRTDDFITFNEND